MLELKLGEGGCVAVLAGWGWGGGGELQAFFTGEGFAHYVWFLTGFFERGIADVGVEIHDAGEGGGRGVGQIESGRWEAGLVGGGGCDLIFVEGSEGVEAGCWVEGAGIFLFEWVDVGVYVTWRKGLFGE